MSELAVALFTAALAGPVPYYPPSRCPETGAQRAERLAVIALSIDAETVDADDWAPGWRREDWAWGAFVKMRAESRFFAVEVHDGRARGDRGRSVCLGQIMDGGERLVGVDYASTRRCVHEVLRHMVIHRERCRVGPASLLAVASVYVGYGTGGQCRPDYRAKHGGRFGLRRAAEWARLSGTVTR